MAVQAGAGHGRRMRDPAAEREPCSYCTVTVSAEDAGAPGLVATSDAMAAAATSDTEMSTLN